MDWVHCNSCYFQPSPARKDIIYSLTSCGHILCSTCTAAKDKYCFICQSMCNLVCLSKQLPQDVMVYFTSPHSLIDKFITQFERVVQFQNTQRTRLLKYKLHQIQVKTEERQREIIQLDKENTDLKTKLKSGTPMSVTPSPPVIVRVNPSPLPSLNKQFRPPPPPRGVSNVDIIRTPQTAANLLPPPSLISGRRPRSVGPPPLSTPSYKKRLTNRGGESPHYTFSPSPSPTLSTTPTSSKRSFMGADRLCVRTPPVDGRIGTIPGSKDSYQLLTLSSSPKRMAERGVNNATIRREPLSISPIVNRQNHTSLKPLNHYRPHTSLSKPHHPSLPPYPCYSPSFRHTHSIKSPMGSSMINNIKL